MNRPRSFAIVPAAGHSQRMGEHKLLLPWNGSTIIEHVLAAWLASDVSQVVVVIRKTDVELLATCRDFSVEAVRPDVDPADMKGSVQCGLRFLADEYRAAVPDVWLLAPADLPRLRASLINRVLASHQHQDPAIVVPTALQRRGHPVLFPWCFTSGVFELGADEGVNQLLEKYPTKQVPVPTLASVEDVDTPADYRRLRRKD